MNFLDTKISIPSNSLKLSSPSSPSFYPSASSLSSKNNNNNNYNYVEQSQTPSVTPLPIPSPTSSPSDKPAIFLIVGAAIIILGGIFYLVKLMRKEKHKKSRKRNGGSNNNKGNIDSSIERNSFVQNYGSNTLTPLQQEDVNVKKKITAADHLEAIKRFFSQLFHLNNDNKKKEERNANLELELSSLESQEIQRKNHHRSFNINNPYNNKSTIHHPINNALNNDIIKSPSPVYHFPSPSLSIPSSLSSIPDSPKIRNSKYGNSRIPYISYSSINNSNPSINS